jgi:hypothetical protein
MRRTASKLIDKISLFEQNPHLQDPQTYQVALRRNVLSSTAIEGIRKPAEKALPDDCYKR